MLTEPFRSLRMETKFLNIVFASRVHTDLTNMKIREQCQGIQLIVRVTLFNVSAAYGQCTIRHSPNYMCIVWLRQG